MNRPLLVFVNLLIFSIRTWLEPAHQAGRHTRLLFLLFGPFYYISKQKPETDQERQENNKTRGRNERKIREKYGPNRRNRLSRQKLVGKTDNDHMQWESPMEDKKERAVFRQLVGFLPLGIMVEQMLFRLFAICFLSFVLNSVSERTGQATGPNTFPFFVKSLQPTAHSIPLIRGRGLLYVASTSARIRVRVHYLATYCASVQHHASSGWCSLFNTPSHRK